MKGRREELWGVGSGSGDILEVILGLFLNQRRGLGYRRRRLCGDFCGDLFLRSSRMIAGLWISMRGHGGAYSSIRGSYGEE